MILIDELQAVCNQLDDVENEVYSLSNDNELEETEIRFDSILTSLDIVVASVTNLIKAADKESSLIKENETLRALYNEYTTIRDLIGSEE